MPTVSLPRATFARVALLLALSATAATAQQGPAPVVRIYTASDLAGPKQALDLPRAGDYTIWAWSSPGEGYAVGFEGKAVQFVVPGAPMTTGTLRGFSVSPEGNDGRPAWRAVGRMIFDPKSPVTIVVPRQTREVKEKVVDEKKGDDDEEDKKAAEAPTQPVPALLAFTTDEKADLAPTLDIVRGRLDSTDPVADPRRATSRTRNEGANFVPPTTRQAWLDRAGHVRTQLLVSLGLWPMLPKTELRPRVYGKLDRDGYTIEKVVLETLPGFTLSGNLYRPKGKTGRLPLVLCPHGHWKEGRVNVDVQARCIWWAKKLGCVVFMYDMVGYADGTPFGHAFLDDRLQRWGLSLPTLQTWNSIRALDWLTTLPDVDPARVGITGESGGGTQTFLLTAIDPRIKVSCPVVMVSHKMQGGCVCENCAGLRIGTDNVEIAALTAPRPLKIVGADDWTDETMTSEFPTLRKVYGLVGAADRVSADKFNFPHNYNRTTRNAVYAFMGRWLVGIDDSASTAEGDVRPEEPEALFTFGKDHPAPSDAKTPEQLEVELVGVLGRALDKLAPTTVAAPWEAARGLLLAALEVRVGLVEPPSIDLATAEVRRSSRDGVSVVHSVVSRPTGDRVPVVRLTPRDATGRATVVFTARGKADLLGPDGGPSALVRALLARGQSVIGLDPLFVGESIDPRKPAVARPTVAHIATYNPTLPADRAQDLATVLAWSRTRPDIREVNLVALGEAGPLALLARPALTGLARTAIDLDGFDYGDGSADVPPGLDLPGVLQFGGLKAAAALSAPSPLWLSRVPAGFAKAWPTKAYALADAPGMLRLDESAADPKALARWIDSGE